MAGCLEDLPWLQSAFLSKELSDCKLKVIGGEKVFPVHRVIVSLQSPVFKRLLDPQGSFKESAETSGAPVAIGEVSEEALEATLFFIYGKTLLEGSSLALVLEVAEFAHRMEIKRLWESAIAIACEKLRHSDSGEDFFIVISAIRIIENQELLESLLVRISGVEVMVKLLIQPTSSFVSRLTRSEVASVLDKFLGPNKVSPSLREGLSKKGVAFLFILLWCVADGSRFDKNVVKMVGAEENVPARDLGDARKSDLDLESDDALESCPVVEIDVSYDRILDDYVDGVIDGETGDISYVTIRDSTFTVPSKLRTLPRHENGELESLLSVVDWTGCVEEDLTLMKEVFLRTDLSSRFLQGVSLDMWIGGKCAYASIRKRKQKLLVSNCEYLERIADLEGSIKASRLNATITLANFNETLGKKSSKVDALQSKVAELERELQRCVAHGYSRRVKRRILSQG